MVLATLPAGETVGEVALVLRRKANADVIAVHPTVTLFLPRKSSSRSFKTTPPSSTAST